MAPAVEQPTHNALRPRCYQLELYEQAKQQNVCATAECCRTYFQQFLRALLSTASSNTHLYTFARR